MTETAKRATVAIAVALALVPLLLFTYFGLHNRLLADDYAYLGLARTLGTWESMLAWYDVWNPSYSGFILHGLLVPLGAAAPPFFSVVFVATSLVAYGWMINAALAYLRISAWRSPIVLALAALSVAATINGYSAAQVFYYLTVSIRYAWPGVMLLLGIALAVEAARRLRGNVQQLLAATFSAIYAFVNAGFSEMYVVFQLSAVALIAVFVYFFKTGPKRKNFLIIALSACLGTIASFALQLTSPGFAIRSAVLVNDGYLMTPVRGLTELISQTLDLTMLYAGDPTNIAGFMLTAFAGMFMSITASKRSPSQSIQLRMPQAAAPIAFALIVQLLFLPILWSHRSDNIQVMGQFSFAFMTAIGINMLTIAILLLLLWRRWLGRLIAKRNGLMMYCSCVLLAVCLLFALTQFRSIHHRASFYLFISAVSLLIMLAGHLTFMSADPRLSRLCLTAVYMTASALIILAAMLGVKMFGAGYVLNRTLASTTNAFMVAGFMNGLLLGALIHRGFCLTNAQPICYRMFSVFNLLVTLTIAAGVTIGQAPRINEVRRDVEIWESRHQEIIRLRDAGDSTVYTKSFPSLAENSLGSTPSRYKRSRLDWRKMLFYELDISRTVGECRLPESWNDHIVKIRIVCRVIRNSEPG